MTIHSTTVTIPLLNINVIYMVWLPWEFSNNAIMVRKIKQQHLFHMQGRGHFWWWTGTRCWTCCCLGKSKVAHMWHLQESFKEVLCSSITTFVIYQIFALLFFFLFYNNFIPFSHIIIIIIYNIIDNNNNNINMVLIIIRTIDDSLLSSSSATKPLYNL